MAGKIPPEHFEEILTRSAGGEGLRSIAAWLDKDHGVKVSAETVAKVVRRDGAARAHVAKTTARTALAKSVISDIGVTDRQTRRAVWMSAKTRHDPDTWVKVSRELREWIALRAKLSGADQPDESTQPAIVMLPPLDDQ